MNLPAARRLRALLFNSRGQQAAVPALAMALCLILSTIRSMILPRASYSFHIPKELRLPTRTLRPARRQLMFHHLVGVHPDTLGIKDEATANKYVLQLHAMQNMRQPQQPALDPSHVADIWGNTGTTNQTINANPSQGLGGFFNGN